MLRRAAAVSLFVLCTALSLGAQSDAAFVAWARAHVVPIDTNGQAFPTLDRALGPVHLIGVGESVHETEPFLTFRLQLLQDLVRRHRVTALILESGMPEAMALDDYVRGKVEPIDFDATLPGGFGNLDAIRRTMDWLREWNRGPGRKHPVGVYGADFAARSGSMVPTLDRIQELTAGDPGIKAAIDSIRPLAIRLSAGWWKGAAQKYDPLPAAEKEALTSNVTLLAERVRHLSEGDKDRLAWARQLALLLQRNEEALRLTMFATSAPRDHAMADNALWILGRLGPGERAVYWAHNAHVQKVPVQGPPLPPGQFTSAGMRLHAALGRKYYAIATTYGGPSIDDATPAKNDSVDAALERVAKGSFLLKLSGGRRPARVDTWLAQERAIRFQTGYLLVSLREAFDAVAYFDHATKAVRIPK